MSVPREKTGLRFHTPLRDKQKPVIFSDYILHTDFLKMFISSSPVCIRYRHLMRKVSLKKEKKSKIIVPKTIANKNCVPFFPVGDH